MENPLIALSIDLAATADKAGRSVVAVNARWRNSSSGVIWRKDVIVTADHTIRREEEIRVTLPDGRAAVAELAGRDLDRPHPAPSKPETWCSQSGGRSRLASTRPWA
jgi:S1-C subfamily serine protease